MAMRECCLLESSKLSLHVISCTTLIFLLLIFLSLWPLKISVITNFSQTPHKITKALWKLFSIVWDNDFLFLSWNLIGAVVCTVALQVFCSSGIWNSISLYSWVRSFVSWTPYLLVWLIPSFWRSTSSTSFLRKGM